MNVKKCVRSAVVVIMAIVVALAMVGCSDPTKEAEAAVASQMDKIANCDFGDADMDGLKKELKEYNVDADAFMKSIFGNMTYKITGSEEFGDDVIVTMDVTNVDMQKVSDNWVKELKKQVADTNSDLMKAYRSGGVNKLYTAIFDLLMSEIDNVNEGGNTTTETLEVTVKKADNGWEPQFTNSDLEKMSGNLTEIMQKAMSSM